MSFYTGLLKTCSINGICYILGVNNSIFLIGVLRKLLSLLTPNMLVPNYGWQGIGENTLETLGGASSKKDIYSFKGLAFIVFLELKNDGVSTLSP